MRLVLTDPRASCSYGEMINSLDGAGIQPDEMKAIFKVSTVDSTYSLLFSFGDTVEKVVGMKQIEAGNCKFDIMKMNEQVVSL